LDLKKTVRTYTLVGYCDQLITAGIEVSV